MRDINDASALESVHAPTSTCSWTVNDVRELVWRKFGKRACWLQIQAALALYQGNDVIVCAATGFGKTLTFWIPLVMALEENRDKVSIVVTPLNLLGRQNVEVLEKVGISVVAIDAESAGEEVFKDIEAGKYSVIIINPELLMGNARVKKLWKFKFGSKILNFIFDEAHCISQWGDFRSEYRLVGELRYILNKKIPFYAVSATLPRMVLEDVRQILRLRSDTVYLQRTTDRPDIHLMARPLSFSAKSFRDLDFLVPKIPEGYQAGDELTMRKFVVFFNSVREAEDAAKHLMRLLPKGLQHKIAWFHSVMSSTFRKDATSALRNSDLWGLCATDAFGMGVDLPDIEIIVQWRATCSLCTLWQRFGRAARGSGYDAVAILLFEKKYLREVDSIPADPKAAVNASKRLKRKAPGDLQPASSKRPALSSKPVNISGCDDHDMTQIAVDTEQSDVCVEKKLLIEECRRRYLQVEACTKKKKGRAGKHDMERGSPMHDYLNAHLVFKCQQLVLRAYFDNDSGPVNDHIACDPESLTGCPRCAPQVVQHCCDMCDPAYFTPFCIQVDGIHEVEDEHSGSDTESELDLDIAKIVARKSVVKKLKVTNDVVMAREELYKWRREHATVQFGAGNVAIHGSHLLMPDSMIDRIISCAQVAKIPDLKSLIIETGWRQDLAERYGNSLLAIVHARYPHQTIRKKKADENAIPSTSATSRVMHCSVCGGERHNRRSNLCPMKNLLSDVAAKPAQPSSQQAPAAPPLSRSSVSTARAPTPFSQPSNSMPSSNNINSNTAALPPFYQMLLQQPPVPYPQYYAYTPAQQPL